MERDFLGINGKESGQLVKGDGRGSRQDGAASLVCSSPLYGGSAMQWPFSGKVNSLQPFVSFKKVEEETPKRIVSGFQRISSVDAFEANQKSSVLAPERSFSLNGQSIQQNGMHSYQPQSTNSFSVSSHHVNGGRMFPMASHHAFPIASGSQFFKVQSSSIPPSTAVSSLKQQPFRGGIAVNMPVAGSVHGVFSSRHVMKPSPSTAQLTIFYAGSINVFDNVSLDKAQEIMSLASKASNTTSVVGNTISDPPMPGSHVLNAKQIAIQKKTDVAPPCSGLSSTPSVPSQSGNLCRSASSSNGDSAGPNSAGPFASTRQQEPPTLPVPLGATAAANTMARAVPQARKASLARFFEKRKERVTSVEPYPTTKKSMDCNGLENDNMSSKSSSTDITLSNNCDKSQCFGQHKNNCSSGESPSTKLEI